MNDDESLMSLVEQAEAITEAWIESLPILPDRPKENCPSEEIQQFYINGTLDPEQAMNVAEHLGDCQKCRRKVRQWRILREAELGVGTCDLVLLREIMDQEPELAARALVRVSQRISRLVLPFPSEQVLPRKMDVGLVSSQGEPLGEWLSLAIESAPRIDAHYRLCFRIRTLEAGYEGYRLHIWLKNNHGKIGIGTVTLKEGLTGVSVDLSDLYIQPGYLPTDALEAVAERVLEGVEPVSSALETSPQLPVGGTEIITAETASHTMTAEQLAGLSLAKRKSTTAKPAPPKPTIRRKDSRQGKEEK